MRGETQQARLGSIPPESGMFSPKLNGANCAPIRPRWPRVATGVAGGRTNRETPARYATRPHVRPRREFWRKGVGDERREHAGGPQSPLGGMRDILHQLHSPPFGRAVSRRSAKLCHPRGMATAQSLLTLTDNAITALLVAMADPGVQEYQIGNRRVRRAEFSTTLLQLRQTRTELQREVARANTSPVRLATFGRARSVDR